MCSMHFDRQLAVLPTEVGLNHQMNSKPLTGPLDGKVEDEALVPLVFVAHLVEELSIKSSFIANIGCEQTVVEGMQSSGCCRRSR